MLKKKPLSQSMASMRELFPLYDYKKTQKNFIKENIQKVKGCNGCLLEKKMLKKNNLQDKHTESKPTKPSSNVPSIKYNLKVIKRKPSPHKANHDTTTSNTMNENEMNLINQSCQTDINRLDLDKISINCQSCGQIIDRRNVALQTSADIDTNSDKKTNKLPNTKELPHKKKECPAKKSLDLSNYKMGVVPKYLKEKNAKLELEQKEKAEQERLAELRGLNDPKCPPGHMLMPRDQLRNQIEKMQDEFDGLIRQLNMMPVSSDSYRVKQRKIQIEKALKELEEKLELFKSGKVFVKISD